MCKNLNVFELVLSGGEPFIHPKIYEILQRIEHEDSYPQIKFLTNGLAIYKKYLNILENINCNFQISLDGANPEIHEILRPRNTFYQTLEAIRKIVSLDKKVVLGSVLHKKNMRNVEKLIDLAIDLGVKGINFVNLIPMGIRDEDFVDLRPSKEDKYIFLKKIGENNTPDGLNISIDLDFDYYTMYHLSSKYIDMQYNPWLCEAATKKCVIDTNGDVYPCELFIPLKTLSAGNLKDNDLGDLWNHSENFKFVRENLFSIVKQRCGTCNHWNYCRGGCRALTKYIAGGLYGPDPRCEYYKGG